MATATTTKRVSKVHNQIEPFSYGEKVMGTSKKTCQSASDVQFANFLVIRIQIQRDKKIQKNRLVWFNIPLTYYAYDGPVNCGYF